MSAFLFNPFALGGQQSAQSSQCSRAATSDSAQCTGTERRQEADGHGIDGRQGRGGTCVHRRNIRRKVNLRLVFLAPTFTHHGRIQEEHKKTIISVKYQLKWHGQWPPASAKKLPMLHHLYKNSWTQRDQRTRSQNVQKSTANSQRSDAAYNHEYYPEKVGQPLRITPKRKRLFPTSKELGNARRSRLKGVRCWRPHDFTHPLFWALCNISLPYLLQLATSSKLRFLRLIEPVAVHARMVFNSRKSSGHSSRVELTSR